MQNRRQVNETTIQFEDWITPWETPYIGQFHEVPMNAFGSIVARYKTTKIEQEGKMNIITAELA